MSMNACLVLIYSDENYMGIILLPNCTCMPCFNFRHFAVYKQST